MSSYVVIGVGRFGFHIAQGLAKEGINVTAVDNDPEQIREIGEYVQDAIILDSTDMYALKEAGIGNMDVAIVSIGEDIESSLLTVMALKELGVETVIAKAITEIHGKILSKLNVTKVVYPEKESALRLVKGVVQNLNYETINLSITMKIAKILVPPFLLGVSILSPMFKDELGVKPIAYKHQGAWYTSFEKDNVLEKGDILVVLGDTSHINALSKKV